MSDEVKVSVLMPVYKTDESFLREAIASVLAQTYRDFEFLILDDCPEDDRECVVRSYRDARIVYLKNAHTLGIAGARNRLIDLAKGAYLAVFDHDDVCAPERLAEQVAYLDAHPACGVVSSWVRNMPRGDVKRYPVDDHEIKLLMMRESALWHPAAMIRREILVRTGLRYDPAFSPVEDYMLWLNLVNETLFHNLPKPLLAYRRHARGASTVRKAELEAADLRCKAWAKVHLPELWEEYRMRRTTTRHVRLLGLPLLKIVSAQGQLEVRLFGCLPLLKISFRDRFETVCR